MNSETEERLFGYRHAFDHPATITLVLLVASVLTAAVVCIALLSLSGRLDAKLRRELWLRTASWMGLTPLLCLPILAGGLWTILTLGMISLWCNEEYSRATGLFREKLVNALTIIGILALYAAALDHWYNFFVVLVPLGVIGIAIVSIPLDRPSGYIQRTGLAIFGFLLFGSALGHLAYMANDWNYRPIVLLVLVAVSLNDVFAFVVGKTVGGLKLLPRTSPNKTLSGSLGALVLTTTLVTLLSAPIFAGTAMGSLHHRIALGAIISVIGQLSDLMLSSIKRDIGIKDTGVLIPGHGGVLDRFNSLLLVAPAVFHYVGYHNGFGLDQPMRIFF